MADTPITLRLTLADPVPGVRYSLQKDDAPGILDPAPAGAWLECVRPGGGADGSPACASVRSASGWRVL